MRKRVVILGAGQMGAAALRLANEKNIEIIAFGDNAGPYPRTLYGVPVVPVSDAVKLGAEYILIAVASRERCLQLENQARECGYNGQILLLADFYDMIDIRGASVALAAERVISAGIDGDIAELGVYKGENAAVLNRLFPSRRLWLFDTFEGFAECDAEKERAVSGIDVRMDEFADTSEELVLSRLPFPERAVIRKGFFPDTADGIEEKFAFVSIDVDLYAPTLAGLEYFLPRMSGGAVLVLHDYLNPRFAGVKLAVNDYEAANGNLSLVPLGDLHGTAVIVKT